MIDYGTSDQNLDTSATFTLFPALKCWSPFILNIPQCFLTSRSECTRYITFKIKKKLKFPWISLKKIQISHFPPKVWNSKSQKWNCIEFSKYVIQFLKILNFKSQKFKFFSLPAQNLKFKMVKMIFWVFFSKCVIRFLKIEKAWSASNYSSNTLGNRSRWEIFYLVNVENAKCLSSWADDEENNKKIIIQLQWKMQHKCTFPLFANDRYSDYSLLRQSYTVFNQSIRRLLITF